MTEQELIAQWTSARWHIIVSQIAPTLLLALTVWMLLEGLAGTPIWVRLAATGILLASGILGAATQYGAATEGAGVVAALQALDSPGPVAQRIIGMGAGVLIVRFVTPTIFALVFVALMVALYV